VSAVVERHASPRVKSCFNLAVTHVAWFVIGTVAVNTVPLVTADACTQFSVFAPVARISEGAVVPRPLLSGTLGWADSISVSGYYEPWA
jgi:hypothetical protein